MDLLPSQFEPAAIERWGMGAGVLPLGVDPSGELHVLLGRERYVNQWKGSCRWSGFEGSRKEGECIKDAAIREFCEESMAIVIEEADLRRAIEAREYYIRIVLRITGDRTPDRYHVTYVVFVDWDPDLSSRFQTTRSHVEYVERLAQEWRHIRPSFLGEQGEEVGPVREKGDGGYVVWKSVHNVPCILQPPWMYDSERTDRVRAEIYDERCRRLGQWSNVRERIKRATSIEHRSIHCSYDSTWGLVQDVHVSRDFLEKDQIRWWNVAQLEQVLEGRGNLGAERFRPYFLPVLQTLLGELRRTPPRAADGMVQLVRTMQPAEQQKTRDDDGDSEREPREDDDAHEATEVRRDAREPACEPCQDPF
jgi:hypothetical protein